MHEHGPEPRVMIRVLHDTAFPITLKPLNTFYPWCTGGEGVSTSLGDRDNRGL